MTTKKSTTTPDGAVLEYSEKVLTYWSRKYYEKEKIERKKFYDFVTKYLENPHLFRLNSTQTSVVRKYLKKNVMNRKTGELLNLSDLSAVINEEALMLDYSLMGYYTLATSEINMDDREIIKTYSNLVEIEEQFHIMKSTLETRPMYVRTEEHVVAHLSICAIALILIRLIQSTIKKKHPELLKDGLLFNNVLSADRIQAAMKKWMLEKVGDIYYRFCNIDDPDLSLILDSFGVNIPKKCFKIGEVRQLKSKMEMST